MHGINGNNLDWNDYKNEQKILAKNAFQKEYGSVTDDEY